MDESAAGPLQGGRCPPGSLSTLVLFALRQQRAPRPPLASIVVIVLSWVENNGFEPLTPCLQSRCSSQLS